MKTALKLIFAFAILFQFNDTRAQQLLASGPPVKKAILTAESYFYVGDRIKVEFTGVEKKMEFWFSGTSLEPTDPAGFGKVENIEKQEFAITKEGPHKLFLSKIKGTGEIRIYRYPAPGKENLPTAFSTRFKFKYTPMESKTKRFPKAYSKEGTKTFVVGPPDQFLSKKMQDYNLKRGLVVVDSTTVIDVAKDDLVDRVLNYQKSYRFQKGDTVAFEITFSKKASRFTAENGTYVGVIRADGQESFNPLTQPYWGWPLPTLNISGILKVTQSFSGSFVLTSDGVYSFFTASDATYNFKIVRFPGAGGNRAFKTAVEMVPVWQDDKGYFALEPRLD